MATTFLEDPGLSLVRGDIRGPGLTWGPGPPLLPGVATWEEVDLVVVKMEGGPQGTQKCKC